MKKRIVALLLLIVLLVPAAVSSAASYYRVTTTSLRVRYLPSDIAKVLGSYRRDYAMTVKRSKDGWSYVRFSDGKEGYVQSKYISRSASYKAWITSDNTSLRRGPDGNFSAVAILAKGRQVTVLSHGAKYDYVSAGSLGTGYVMNGLLSRKKVKASGTQSESTTATGGGYYAYVLNSGYRKVNLRSYASTKAPVIAQYGTGTKVYVISHGSTWDKVRINGDTGYMMTKYLNKNVPAPTPTRKPKPTNKDNTYTAYVVSANKGNVNVRRGPGNYAVAFSVPYGVSVTVLKHGATWDYIEYNGKKGYIKNTFLQLKKPKDAPDPTPTPTKKSSPSTPYVAIVTSSNGKSVNVHKQPYETSSNVDFLGDHGRLSVGTEVTVLGVSKGWAHIEYNGKKGWMMNKFLKKKK